MNGKMNIDVSDLNSTPNMGINVNSPTSLFVWWELSTRQRSEIKKNMGSSVEWCLRVRKEQNENESIINVDPSAGTHYLELEAGEKYEVELGWYAAGEYHPICGPLGAEMPPEEPETEKDPEWVDMRTGQKVEREGEKVSRPTGQSRPGIEWEEGMVGNGSSGGLCSSSGNLDREARKSDENEGAVASDSTSGGGRDDRTVRA